MPGGGAHGSPASGLGVRTVPGPPIIRTALRTIASGPSSGCRTVWVMANVYETDLGLVSAGESAEILTDAQTKPPTGRVDYVAALVDPGTKATARSEEHTS